MVETDPLLGGVDRCRKRPPASTGERGCLVEPTAMTEYESTAEESSGTDVEQRTLRAATESITLLETGPRVEGSDGLYEAVSQSGARDGDGPDTYVVNARRVACECPDHEHRNARCKHLRRLELIKGERELPVSIPAEDVNSNIGIGVSGGRTTEDLLAARAPTAATAGAKAVADGGEVHRSITLKSNKISLIVLV
jgi:hypothetical protein